MERRDLQLEESSPTGLVKDGTYVCPKYDKFGKKTQSGEFIGSRGKIDKMALAIAKHSAAHGEQLPALIPSDPFVKQVAVKGKSLRVTDRTSKVGKQPAQVPQPKLQADITFTEEETTGNISYKLPKYKSLEQLLVPKAPPVIPIEVETGIDIVFQVASAKMKLTVCGLMEEKTSLCLVFKNDKELRFIPETGSELNLLISNRVLKVYYPGTLFTWIDDEKKIMMLIKTDENDQ